MSAGQDPALIWDLTPREIQVILAGVRDRHLREYNDRMIQAYHTAFLPLQEKPPRLEDLLIKDRRQAPRVRDWREQMAAFMAWGEATGR